MCLQELKSIASAGVVALQDAAMLFADPYVEQALVRDLFARMLDVLDREATPKVRPVLCVGVCVCVCLCRERFAHRSSGRRASL